MDWVKLSSGVNILSSAELDDFTIGKIMNIYSQFVYYLPESIFFLNLCFNILILNCGYEEEQWIMTMIVYSYLSLPALLIFIQLCILHNWKKKYKLLPKLQLHFIQNIIHRSWIDSVKIQHENRTNPQNLNADKIMCLISSQIQNYVMSIKEFALVFNVSFSSVF